MQHAGCPFMSCPCQSFGSMALETRCDGGSPARLVGRSQTPFVLSPQNSGNWNKRRERPFGGSLGSDPFVVRRQHADAPGSLAVTHFDIRLPNSRNRPMPLHRPGNACVDPNRPGGVSPNSGRRVIACEFGSRPHLRSIGHTSAADGWCEAGFFAG